MPICENESDYIHQKDIGCISRRYLGLNRTGGRTERDPTDYISSAIRWTDRDACTNNTAVRGWKGMLHSTRPCSEPRWNTSDQWLLLTDPHRTFTFQESKRIRLKESTRFERVQPCVCWETCSDGLTRPLGLSRHRPGVHPG